MTARERLLASLRGLPVDRVPVWLLFPYHRTGYYVDVRTNPLYVPVHEAAMRMAVTLNRRNFSVPLHTPEVTTRTEEVTEAGERVKRTFTEYRGRRLVAETRSDGRSTRAKKPVDCEEALDLYLSMPVETDERRIHAALDAEVAGYLREKAEFPAEHGAMMLSLGEPIGPLYSSAKLEEYAVWSLEHDAEIRPWLDTVLERERIIYRYCLERDLADVFFMVGSEFASPPLVSRATFQRWVVPYASSLISLIHSYGKLVIQHYHGQIAEILPDFLTMAPDGLHTIEAPPIGNCTLRQAFDVVGDRITLIGNIQYDDFRAMEPGEMDRAVQAALEEARGRRFILSPTAGPYEERVPDRMIRNYLTFMESAWRHGAA